jgi:hypothetical protein
MLLMLSTKRRDLAHAMGCAWGANRERSGAALRCAASRRAERSEIDFRLHTGLARRSVA